MLIIFLNLLFTTKLVGFFFVWLDAFVIHWLSSLTFRLECRLIWGSRLGSLLLYQSTVWDSDNQLFPRDNYRTGIMYCFVSLYTRLLAAQISLSNSFKRSLHFYFLAKIGIYQIIMNNTLQTFSESRRWEPFGLFFWGYLLFYWA